MKKTTRFLLVVIILLIPSWSDAADYLLKKDSFVFLTLYQIAHLEKLKGDAFDGYIRDQIEKKQMAVVQEDKIVTVIDSCTFCKYLPAFKVKMKDGKGEGWVLEDQLKKLKGKAAKK